MVRVLPGDFGNTVLVLVSDASAMPIGFHDVMLENLSHRITVPDRYRRWILPPSGVSGRPLCLRTCISGRQTSSSCVVTVNGSLIVSSAVVGPGIAPTAAHM